MSNSYQASLQHVRGRRQYVARAVNAVLEATEGESGVLKNISWANLMSMPTWCLLSQDRIKRLQLFCGAVYVQPLLKSSVDGAVLKQFREIVGDDLFNFLFETVDNIEADAISTVTLIGDDTLEETIRSVGTSVLLGTLSEMNVVKIYMSALGKPLLVLDADQSKQAFNYACQAMQLGAPSKPASSQVTQGSSAGPSVASS